MLWRNVNTGEWVSPDFLMRLPGRLTFSPLPCRQPLALRLCSPLAEELDG